MRKVVCTVCLALALAAYFAPVGIAQTTDASYFGTWKLNLAKSKYEPGPGPKASTRVHEDRGGGLILITTDGVNAQGANTYSQYAYKLDGKPYPNLVKGSQTVATIALKGTDAYTVTFTTYTDAKPTGTGTRTIAKDGKTMTISTKGTNAQGQPTTSMAFWEKQ